MFACLYLPPPANSLSASTAAPVAQRLSAVVALARDFSPRVETPGDRTVTLDISGLGSLIGEPRAIGEELRRAAADAGLRVHIAIAATSTAAILLAHARAGLTVVAPGGEAAALAPLPLRTLAQLRFGLQTPHSRAAASGRGGPDPFAPDVSTTVAATTSMSPALAAPDVDQLARWGLKTLGDLASLPSIELSARLGQQGIRWQKWARGEEMRPLVPAGVAETFEESLDLEWPIEGLEPLSFVVARLLDPLCERLERRDRGAVVLRVTLTLVTRELHERVVELPAPMRDARVLRTLALLDLESHPPAEAIDRVTIAVDVTEGRVLQFGLFARALATDTLATLMARLGALMGSDRVGAPALVDTYRPGAFAMAKFDPPRTFTQSRTQLSDLRAADAGAPWRGALKPSADAAASTVARRDSADAPPSVLRRLRSPIAARVTLEQGRPVRVTTDRRGYGGGRVERAEGPWRSSGDWWKAASSVDRQSLRADPPWNCDEWDVALHDGTIYRLSHALDTDAWFVEGMVD